MKLLFGVMFRIPNQAPPPAIEHLLGEIAYLYEEINEARTRVIQARASRGRKP